MNDKIEWFVWSSGLEEWEPIEGDEQDAFWARMRQGNPSIKLVHAKRWKGRDFEIYVDATHRFLGRLGERVV